MDNIKNKRNHPLVGKIKKIMQSDKEVGRVAQQTPLAIERALELFMLKLCSDLGEVVDKYSIKTVTPSHLKFCLNQQPGQRIQNQKIDEIEEYNFETHLQNIKRQEERLLSPKIKENQSSSQKRGRPKKESHLNIQSKMGEKIQNPQELTQLKSQQNQHRNNQKSLSQLQPRQQQCQVQEPLQEDTLQKCQATQSSVNMFMQDNIRGCQEQLLGNNDDKNIEIIDNNNHDVNVNNKSIIGYTNDINNNSNNRVIDEGIKQETLRIDNQTSNISTQNTKFMPQHNGSKDSSSIQIIDNKSTQNKILHSQPIQQYQESSKVLSPNFFKVVSCQNNQQPINSKILQEPSQKNVQIQATKLNNIKNNSQLSKSQLSQPKVIIQYVQNGQKQKLLQPNQQAQLKQVPQSQLQLSNLHQPQNINQQEQQQQFQQQQQQQKQQDEEKQQQEQQQLQQSLQQSQVQQQQQQQKQQQQYKQQHQHQSCKPILQGSLNTLLPQGQQFQKEVSTSIQTSPYQSGQSITQSQLMQKGQLENSSLNSQTQYNTQLLQHLLQKSQSNVLASEDDYDN